MKKTQSILFVFLLGVYSFSLKSQLIATSYSDAGQKLNGLAGKPKTALTNKPGVLILPAWMGIDERARESAEKLSAMGYYTFVADIYGEGNYPKDGKGAMEQSSYYKTHVDDYRRRISLAIQELIKSGASAGNIVVIGYCFGGTGVLEAARANMDIKGVVSFHGGLARDTTKAIQSIRCKVLVCHGANDFFVPEPQVKAFQNEMRSSKADWQMIYYADAVHSFTDKNAGNDPSKGVAYNEKAAMRSWEHMLQFLRECLGG